MTVPDVLAQLGGVASWTQLHPHVSDRALAAAVRSGEVLRVARGRYALPTTEEHRRVALRHSAVLSHLSAAVAHGWPVKWPPRQPWVTVPRHRKMARRRDVHMTYRDLSPGNAPDGSPGSSARSSTARSSCRSTRRWRSPTPHSARET
jgi:hypothetical protein